MARPREWTEQRIEALGKELEAWFSADEENMFYKSFFAERPDLHPELVSKLQRVSQPFRQSIKRCEEIQESRLVRMALKQKVNPVMAIFVLKNKHGYADKVETTNKNENINIQRGDLDSLDAETLRQRIFQLTERADNK